MPRLAINYAKNFNYKIVCKDLSITDCYAGSSTNWSKRKNRHKGCCNNETSDRYNAKIYTFIREHGGWDNWNMILIEYYPCKTQLESAQRERYWIEELKANLNCNIPSRTRTERNETNKEQIVEYQTEYRKTHKVEQAETQAEWYKENKEHHSEIGALYYQKNKEQILAQQAVLYTCTCGCVITTGSKSKHEKTAKHKKYYAYTMNEITLNLSE